MFNTDITPKRLQRLKRHEKAFKITLNDYIVARKTNAENANLHR